VKRLFITGIRGFIGSALARSLRANGWTVSGSSSRAAAGVSTIDLGQPFDAACFEGIDAVIHCAYRLGQGTFEANVEGTRAIAQAAAERGVSTQLFVSSFSAHPDAKSEYGRSKLELEQFFSSIGQISIRPGLVIGNGGLYAKLSATVARLPVVAVPAGATPYVGVGELVMATSSILDGRLPGIHRLFHDERVTMSEIVRTIAAVKKKRRIVVPVPLGPSVTAAKALAVASSRFGSVAESLEGLLMSQSFPMTSDLARFGALQSMRGSIEAAEAERVSLEAPC
jgi:NADH dehydrogenase